MLWRKSIHFHGNASTFVVLSAWHTSNCLQVVMSRWHYRRPHSSTMPESESEASAKGCHRMCHLSELFLYAFLENGVRELQANLFPPSPRGGGSFLSNFLLKFTPNNDEEDSRLPKIKETISVRELFSISKEQVFNFQAPRWPTECQVISQRMADRYFKWFLGLGWAGYSHRLHTTSTRTVLCSYWKWSAAETCWGGMWDYCLSILSD